MKEYVNPRSKKSVQIWLITGIIMVFMMVAIGGITRLTESGLSITEWNVVMGSVPPLNQADWNQEFDKYKASPEFQKKNIDFQLNDFKKIYWWEWIHRQWGRIIGIVFFLPFVIFLFRKSFTRSGILRLVFIFFLGGFQGFIGWYMVQSGLVNEPRVSHYRLAMHLLTALLTISLIWWLFLDIQVQFRPHRKSHNIKAHRNLFLFYLFFLIVQITYGAFVAGLDAGQVYNTWPKMGGHWVAPGVFMGNKLEAIHSSDHLVTIQFLHRTIAVLVVLLVGALWFNAKRRLQLSPSQKRGLNGMFLTVIIQFCLGVFTILYAVPISLGLLHQLGAVMLLLFSLHHMHTLYKSPSY